MSTRKIVDMSTLFMVVEKALEFRNQDKYFLGLEDTPREKGLIELLRSTAWLLDAWKLADESPNSPTAMQSLDLGEDWVMDSFLKFRRG